MARLDPGGPPPPPDDPRSEDIVVLVIVVVIFEAFEFIVEAKTGEVRDDSDVFI